MQLSAQAHGTRNHSIAMLDIEIVAIRKLAWITVGCTQQYDQIGIDGQRNTCQYQGQGGATIGALQRRFKPQIFLYEIFPLFRMRFEQCKQIGLPNQTKHCVAQTSSRGFLAAARICTRGGYHSAVWASPTAASDCNAGFCSKRTIWCWTNTFNVRYQRMNGFGGKHGLRQVTRDPTSFRTNHG